MKIKIHYVAILLLLTVSAATAQDMVNTGNKHTFSGAQEALFGNFTNSNGQFVIDGTLYVYQDFTNNTTVDFTGSENTGTTHFTGVSRQIISGTGTTNFYNVVANNTSGDDASIHLQKPISVQGTATFTDGIIEETGSGLVTFKDNATQQSTSNISFVDGKVQKIGDDAFVFPIGDHKASDYYYRYAAISAPSAVTDVFTAEYIWENSNGSYPHTAKASDVTKINDAEYWNIERTSGNSTPQVTLTWNANTTPSDLLTDVEQLVIVRWDGSQWINEGGVVDASSQTVTSNVTGYGIFTLASGINTEELVFPSAFSPNGDNIHDTYVIANASVLYPDFELKIFNRWGSVVYDYKNGGAREPQWWDGTAIAGNAVIAKDKGLPVGTYFYVFTYNKDDKESKSGYIYLNR